MSNVVPALGSTSLGVVIGWLVRYFIRRFKKFTPSVLSTVVSLTFGGVAVKFLDADRSIVWFYPIGVLLGFVAYHIIATMSINKEEARFVKPVRRPDEKTKTWRGSSSRDAIFGKLDGAAYNHPPKEKKTPFDV
jgi:NhaP-type Na+/H+ or K+/H+ antiporter